MYTILIRGPNGQVGVLQIQGSLTIKGGAGTSSLGTGLVQLVDSGIFDIQTAFTWSSASMTSNGISASLKIDNGGVLTVTGGATKLDANIEIGDNNGGAASSMVLEGMTNNLSARAGFGILIDTNGTLNLAQATNSDTAGGITLADGFINDSGKMERSGTDTNAVKISGRIYVYSGGSVVLDTATLLTVSNLRDTTTSLGVSGGNLDLGAGSHLGTNTGIRVSDARSEVRFFGSTTANTVSFIDGNLTINAGELIVGVSEGNGKFTNVIDTGIFSMNGGTLLVSVLGGAGNSKSDSISTYTFNVNAAATLSVGLQNGLQPTVGTVYNVLGGNGSNLTKFGSVTDTSDSMIPWAQTVTNNALTITKFVKVSTTTSVTSNVNPAAPGQAVTFTATVTPASPGIIPTGTVSFFDGTTLLGTGTLSPSGMGAQATFSISTLSLGSRAIAC